MNIFNIITLISTTLIQTYTRHGTCATETVVHMEQRGFSSFVLLIM